MRTTKVAVVYIVLCLAVTCRALGQEHDRFENVCSSLQNATPPDLVQYLNGVTPAEENRWCITWAIHKLGKERYEPAIPALVKLLDFRRPQTRGEETFHGLSEELFPAQEALELIGTKAQPDVLLAIEGDSPSSAARDNAVAVWMEIYKYERPKGVAALKQEEIKVDNEGIKTRLASAIQKALSYCGRQDEAACQQAAVTGVP